MYATAFATILALTSCVVSIQAGGPKVLGPTEFVFSAGEHFSLTCEGDGELQWRYPSSISKDQDNDKFTETRQGSTNTLNVRQALFYFTGYYSCEQEGYEADRVYVFVKDENHLLAMQDEAVVIEAMEWDDLVIPCRPTSPDVDVSLESEIYSFNSSSDNYDPHEGFTLSKATTNFSQTWVCIAYSEKPNQIQYIRSIVHPFPRLFIEYVDEVHVGDNVTIDCSLNSTIATNFHLKWVRPAHLPMDHHVKVLELMKVEGDQGTLWKLPLLIINVTEDDSGMYICQMTLKDIEERDEYFLAVLSSWEWPFFLHFQDNLTHTSVSSPTAHWRGVILTESPVTFKLYHEDKSNDLLTTYPDKFVIQVNSTELFIIVHKPTIRDHGMYNLLSYTNNGTTKDLDLLLLYVHSPPQVSIFVGSGVISPLSKTQVWCQVYCRGCSTMRWTFKPCARQDDCHRADEEYIPGHFTSNEVNDLFSKFTSKILWQPQESGELICRAANEDGVIESKQYILLSDVPEGFYILAPDLITEGDNAVLSCAFSVPSCIICTYALRWLYTPDDDSLPTPVVDRNDIEITVCNGTNSIKSDLSLKEASLNNSGSYICSVDSTFLELKVGIINVTVRELKRPEITYTNLNESVVTVTGWQPVNMTCNAQGMPPPQIQWLHNDEPVLVNEDLGVELHDNNQTLILKTRSPNYEGKYVCTAFNKGGDAKKWVTLRFQGKVNIPLSLTVGIVVVSTLLLASIVYLTVYAYKRSQTVKELGIAGMMTFKEGAVQYLNPALTAHEQVDLLPCHNTLEYPRHKLKLGKQLGVGAFGVVHKAVAEDIKPGERTTTVAVKMAKRNSGTVLVRALASELKIMANLGRNAHVVSLLGAVTKRLSQGELLLIEEFCRFGNLNEYLRVNSNRFVDQLDPMTGLFDLTKTSPKTHFLKRSASVTFIYFRSDDSAQSSKAFVDVESTIRTCNSSRPGDVRGDYRFEEALPLNTTVLISWSYQIARGMEWLAGRRVLHGDLAARNVLLTDGNVVKICDFGMARNIYSSPEYHKSGNNLLPLRWMAIESIRDMVFSTQSDVWSYGIVLWELFSLSAVPYSELTFPDIFNKLLDGYRMEKPNFSPPGLYEIMTDCWKVDPATRPLFTDLSCKLSMLLQESVPEHYLELKEEFDKENELPEKDYLTMVRKPTYHAAHDSENVSDLLCSGLNC